MNKDYVPDKDANMIPWASNIDENIDKYAKTLNLSDDDVTKLKGACTGIDDDIKKNAQAQAAARQATEEKVTSVHQRIEIIRAIVQLSKKSSGYTESIGKALGWVGTDEPFDPSAYKPVISAEVFPGRVTVKFTKKRVQGINIYSKLKDDANWEKLAFDSYSPYEDNRPLHVPGTAEVRQYMAIGVVHDHEIGQASDIVEVTFGG